MAGEHCGLLPAAVSIGARRGAACFGAKEEWGQNVRRMEGQRGMKGAPAPTPAAKVRRVAATLSRASRRRSGWRVEAERVSVRGDKMGSTAARGAMPPATAQTTRLAAAGPCLLRLP